ncbi:MAG: hypothetical protein N3I35_10885 [Clostridia bacterium]|nr:hypothetical protein [Clostridia bacterium]
MSNVLGKECYVLHLIKKNGELDVRWIDKGKIRYGDYKLYIYEKDEIYFKEAIENIYVKRVGNVILINTRDNTNRFEVVVKNIWNNTEIVDLGLINTILNRNTV